MVDTVQIVRDILLSVYLLAGILLTLILLVIAFLLYRAVRGLLKSVNRVTDNVAEFSDLAVDNLVTPMKEGTSFSGAAGNAFGFVTGFLSGLKGGRKDKRERDRERERDRGRDRDRGRRRG
ncbi:MAG: hypothetical protein WD533_02065 [Dehalococcoidia bacterium]